MRIMLCNEVRRVDSIIASYIRKKEPTSIDDIHTFMKKMDIKKDEYTLEKLHDTLYYLQVEFEYEDTLLTGKADMLLEEGSIVTVYDTEVPPYKARKEAYQIYAKEIMDGEREQGDDEFLTTLNAKGRR